MRNILGVEVTNFRSIRQQLTVPLDKQITMVVGPNNSGKTNVLRSLSLILNPDGNKLIEADDFVDPQDQTVDVRTTFPVELLLERMSDCYIMRRHIENAIERLKEFKLTMRLTRTDVRIDVDESLYHIVPRQYFASSDFHADFQQSSRDASKNIVTMLGKLRPFEQFTGTVHVPNVRFIATEGTAIPRFSRCSLAGESIGLSDVVSRIRELDRPAVDRDKARRKLRAICDFIRYCIECKSVDLQVPSTAETILVNIDGREQPISNVGTGIEQLILIGLGSFAFPGKLILIDEPELHFHPRSQKRMMQSLQNQSECKFVIATHSAAVLDAVESNVVRLIDEDGTCKGSLVVNDFEMFQAVRGLGHTPSELIQANYVIWVEGPSDRVYLKHWIEQLDNDLSEGVDYTFVFYGGKVLSHHDFIGEAEDLLNAISIARQFAVVMDSDVKQLGGSINKTKMRVKSEVEDQGGFAWITAHREMENYIPVSVIEDLSKEFDGVTVPSSEFDQVLDSEKVNKVEFARTAVLRKWADWPIDLKEKVEELVRRIRAAG